MKLFTRKIFLIMRLTVFLLTVVLLQARADGLSQERITLSKTNISLTEAFKDLSRQTGCHFLYSNLQLAHAKPVDMDLKNASIDEALRQCLQGQPFTYTIANNTVIIKLNEKADPPPPPLLQPPTVIRGQVRDSATGKPLVGVTIQVKGSHAGTTTDIAGNFSLEVPDGAVLIVSYLGYDKAEIPVNGRQSLAISLSASSTGLNEVVVVGYGTQRRTDVTGAITSIKSAAIQEVPSANLSQALQGQGAGIDIQKSGGNSHPGATPDILIRGTRSLKASNSPLLIVDGIPFNGDINDLNPDDISSVEVLKDASATAIYGSRGANGVLLITTRRGKTGKPVVRYSAYAGFTKNLGEFDVMNASQFENLKKWARLNGNPGVYTGIDDPNLLTDGFFAPEELHGIKTGRNTDWQKLAYRTGLMTDHQLGVSGGTDITRYDISGGFHKETGIYPGQAFERYTLKASIDQNLGKAIKIGLTSLNTFSITNGEHVNPMGQVLRASPMASPYDTSGKLIVGFVPGSANQVWNPLNDFLPGASVENEKRLSTFNSFYAEINLFRGLTYRFNGGVGLQSDVYGNFYASNTSNNLGGLSTSNNSTGFNTDYTLENLLIYNRIFGKSAVNFTGLYSLQQSESQSNSFSDNTVAADFLQFYNPQYSSNLTGSGSYSKWDIISYMGRLNYSFADKYLVTLTLRSDGSSVLAPGNKYHVFPSAAVAWNLINESFLKKTPAITNLKLRASYGSVGNAAIGAYSTLGGLNATNYNYGNTVTTGAYFSDAANPSLTWEYTSTLNLGVDFGFWNNRLTGSIDAYHEYTNSLLLPQALPITSGIASNVLTNVGKTENKGIELSLSAVTIQGENRNSFSWNTSLNIFINRGKITQLANGAQQDISNGWFVGKPTGSYFDYQRAGIWQNIPQDSATAKALGLSLKGTGSVIGTIRVADVNKDGKINADDRVVLGSNQPDWEGGMTNRFSYRGFDFTAVLFARMGSMISSTLYGGAFVNTFQGNYNNLNEHFWTPDNHENYYPKPNSAATRTPYNSLLGYFDGSYLKIRNLSLGYSLPASFLKKMKLSSLRIYTTAQDPFILFSPYRDKYHGMDPETTKTVNVDTPATWSMIFGINVVL